jgi:hypothetical protein
MAKLMNKRKKQGSNLEGKGLDLSGAQLVFQITRYRSSGRKLDFTMHTAVAAFTVLKDAVIWIQRQHYPDDYRVDRKHLVEVNGKLHTVNVYPYKVKIDDPTAPDVVLDSTGFRASKLKRREENYNGEANQSNGNEGIPDGGSGDQG